MSSGNNGEGGGNRTVFRPSPLQQRGQARAEPPPQDAPRAPEGWGAPPPPPPPPPRPQAFQPRLSNDDVPPPHTSQVSRNPLMAAAAPVLALVASMRSGRASAALPELHRQVVPAITEFDRVIAGDYPEETRMRAKYAVCATIDDIIQNLPGTGADGAEWARRSMVVTFFGENIAGDRFWRLTSDMVARPAQHGDVIELYHACLAAGFEGKYRHLANGKRGLHEEMTALYAALEHPRSLSSAELVDHWKGERAPLRKVGLWSHAVLAASIALFTLLILYIALRLMLMSSGGPSEEAVAAINPVDKPVRLSRAAPPAAARPATDQVQTIKTFLAEEIRQGLVVVEEKGGNVRVRTTVGQLFESGSDQLEPGRQALFERIGKAIETEKGKVVVEGHADSDRVGSLSFPDNRALSAARADTVAAIIRGELSDPGRVSAVGHGDRRPIASNTTPEGKSQNRRVEIVVPRRD